MVLTANASIPIGTQCPDFTLESVDGKTYTFRDLESSKALLIAFICNHCPYVQAIENDLIALSRSFSQADLQVIGICSNDFKRYPGDSPEALLKRWKTKDYRFPYLIDSTQEVARAFGAVCTPDLFLYNGQRKLFYHGRFEELKKAIEGLLEGQTEFLGSQHSIGCSIKWSL